MLQLQLGILVLPKPMNGSNILFYGKVWNSTSAPLWLNVRSINTTREKLSKLQEHSNRFSSPLLFGNIFLWTSLYPYLNRAIIQSSWWSSIVSSNMIIFVLFNTHSQPPELLNSSWIIYSRFMASIILLSLIETPLSQQFLARFFQSTGHPIASQKFLSPLDEWPKWSCQQVFGNIFEVFFLWKEKSVGSMVTPSWMVVQHILPYNYSHYSFWSSLWKKSPISSLLYVRGIKGSGGWQKSYSPRGYSSCPQRQFGHGS